jgi:hypothetical protein
MSRRYTSSPPFASRVCSGTALPSTFFLKVMCDFYMRAAYIVINMPSVSCHMCPGEI